MGWGEIISEIVPARCSRAPAELLVKLRLCGDSMWPCPLKNLGSQASHKQKGFWETTATYLPKKMDTRNKFDVLCNSKAGRQSFQTSLS